MAIASENTIAKRRPLFFWRKSDDPSSHCLNENPERQPGDEGQPPYSLMIQVKLISPLYYIIIAISIKISYKFCLR